MTISFENNFSPVTGADKSGAIVSQIEAAVADRQFAPGTRLPTERQLQEIFHTSRGAVREALRILRQKGLLYAKKGARGGYFLKEVDINETIDHLAVMIRQQQIPLTKLLEFQHAMDQAVLVSAISHAEESEIDRLEQLSDELLELCADPNPDFNRISVVDKELNLLMVDMTKNPFFNWMMRSVQLTFRSYEFVVYENPGARMDIARNWRNTARAVRGRQVQKALGLYGHWYAILEKALVDKFGEDALFTALPEPSRELLSNPSIGALHSESGACSSGACSSMDAQPSLQPELQPDSQPNGILS